MPTDAQSRPLPANPEAEARLLTAVLLRGADALDEVSLRPSEFHNGRHRAIYTTMRAMVAEGLPVDDTTAVVDGLEKSGRLEAAGGAAYLGRLLDTVPTGSPGHLARIIREKALLRQIVLDSLSSIEDVHDRPDEALDRHQRRALDIGADHGDQGAVRISEILPDAVDRYEELGRRQSDITGVPTGFGVLDHITSGLQPCDLIILAGRPSMGKTALALNITRNAAGDGHAVLFFSLEMSRQQLIDRLISSEAGLNSGKFRAGRFAPGDWPRVTAAAATLNDLSIVVDDTAGLTHIELTRRARRAKRVHGVDLVVIDYLQQMTTGERGQNRNNEVETITRALKALAKDLRCPVLLLSQLNRECEKRNDKRPKLGDLRDSGAVEQDADLVAFVYRDEVYNKDENKPNRGTAEVIIEKNRHGPLATVRLRWQGHLTRFLDPPTC